MVTKRYRADVAGFLSSASRAGMTLDAVAEGWRQAALLGEFVEKAAVDRTGTSVTKLLLADQCFVLDTLRLTVEMSREPRDPDSWPEWVEDSLFMAMRTDLQKYREALDVRCFYQTDARWEDVVS